jgi:hypothetical protein
MWAGPHGPAGGGLLLKGSDGPVKHRPGRPEGCGLVEDHVGLWIASLAGLRGAGWLRSGGPVDHGLIRPEGWELGGDCVGLWIMGLAGLKGAVPAEIVWDSVEIWWACGSQVC